MGQNQSLVNAAQEEVYFFTPQVANRNVTKKHEGDQFHAAIRKTGDCPLRLRLQPHLRLDLPLKQEWACQ